MKVLITATCHHILKEELSKAGYDVLYLPEIDRETLLDLIPEATGLIVSTRLKIDTVVLEKAVHLQWIGRLGSGLELIDVSFAQSRGIRVLSSPEGNCDAVGEHALALLLNLMNRITVSSSEIREGKWLRDENRGVEMNGKTVGIIGFGHTGRAFARKLKGFDVRILAHDKYRSGFSSDSLIEASLEQVLEECDVLSLHLPLTEETHHFAGRSFFQQVKKAPFFLNTCRGQVHDTAALIDAIREGRISGAGLDVLENERLPSYTSAEQEQLQWLLKQPNVLITPHIAGYSHEAFYKMSQILVDKILK